MKFFSKVKISNLILYLDNFQLNFVINILRIKIFLNLIKIV